MNLERVNGLEIDDFEDLKIRKLIPSRFDYCTDFRWSSRFTLDLYNLILESYPKLDKSNSEINSVNVFYHILQEAVKDNLGLVAYGD
tara:strand:+ start:200 stop:460 length:261 start_codon:yes stop_codon:yes gene_type:complete